MTKSLIIFVTLAVVVTASANLWLQSYLSSPLNISTVQHTLIVEKGNTLRGVANRLNDQGVLLQPGIFTGYGRITGVAERIQAGEYELQAGDTPDTLLTMLIDGRVKLHSITIVEGWTVRELLKALDAHPAIQHTLKLDSPQDLSALLELDYPHPEGLFFPETYHFPRNTSDLDLLRQAHQLLKTKLNQAWSGRVPQGVLTKPYDGLILASIVERETALAQERAKIAGVFIRRLEQGMRLQTDPTVIYGLGESFNGNLTRHDLKTDTPYNTYTRRGLPPTPIALPGEGALQAMAHPEPGDALYFVATGRDDGSHYFTATLEEHNAAVALFLAQLKKSK